MRRLLSTVLAGGALLTASACGTAPDSPSPNAAASAPAAAAASATPAVGAVCEALAQAYSKNMAPYAKALNTLATDPTTIAAAQQSLAAFATSVQEATAASTDTQVRNDGKKAAEQMHRKSTDDKFFATIKTPDDAAEAVGPTLTEWLSPVSRHCH